MGEPSVSASSSDDAKSAVKILPYSERGKGMEEVWIIVIFVFVLIFVAMIIWWWSSSGTPATVTPSSGNSSLLWILGAFFFLIIIVAMMWYLFGGSSRPTAVMMPSPPPMVQVPTPSNTNVFMHEHDPMQPSPTNIYHNYHISGQPTIEGEYAPPPLPPTRPVALQTTRTTPLGQATVDPDPYTERYYRPGEQVRVMHNGIPSTLTLPPKVVSRTTDIQPFPVGAQGAGYRRRIVPGP